MILSRASSAALAWPEAWACCLPWHNTVTTCKGAIKTLGTVLSVLCGILAPPGCPYRAACWLSAGLATQHRALGLLCSLSRPLSPAFTTPLTVQKLSHQPAKVLLILLRMLSICSPAEQQGIFQLQAALETFAVHRPSHHYTYHLAERLLMELELILKVASLCGKTLFRPRKGRKLSSSLFFRSISKTFFRLVAVWEGHPGKSVFGNRHFLSLERK